MFSQATVCLHGGLPPGGPPPGGICLLGEGGMPPGGIKAEIQSTGGQYASYWNAYVFMSMDAWKYKVVHPAIALKIVNVLYTLFPWISKNA